MASEGLEHTNRSALRCSFYLENKKYRFVGRSPLPMKGRERSSLRFANRVQQKCNYFPQNTNTKKLKINNIKNAIIRANKAIASVKAKPKMA
jgi:hypothetical protein